MKKDVFYSELTTKLNLTPIQERFFKIISNVRIKCIDQVPDNLFIIKNSKIKFLNDSLRLPDEIKDYLYYTLEFPFNNWSKELETAFINEVLFEANKEYHKVRFVENIKDYLKLREKEHLSILDTFKFKQSNTTSSFVGRDIANVRWYHDNTGVLMFYGLKIVLQKAIKLLEEEGTSQPDEQPTKDKNETGLSQAQLGRVLAVVEPDYYTDSEYSSITDKVKMFMKRHNIGAESYNSFRNKYGNAKQILNNSFDLSDNKKQKLEEHLKEIEPFIKRHYKDSLEALIHHIETIEHY